MNGSDYGGWVPWESAGAHSSQTTGFPRGYLLLRMQTQIYSFLAALVPSVAALSRRVSIGPAKWTEHAELSIEKIIGSQFDCEYVNKPFLSPPKFDLEKLVTIAQTRRDAAGDHL